MVQKSILSLCVMTLVFPFLPVRAWSNHSLGTYLSFWNSHPELRSQTITVESLDSFLQKEASGLQQLLRYQDHFLKTQIPDRYPPLAEENFFRSKTPDRRTAFFKALRCNPNTKTELFVQRWNNLNPDTNFNPSKITILKDNSFLKPYSFSDIKEGSKITPLEVLATATDEPDYGIDKDLFLDNNQDFNKNYGFGTQTFGSPDYESSSQAPFHMGIYHESEIVYSLAGFLRKTYPEVRIYQFQSLSEYAFRSGHPYWGYRFMGWALHYVQDLTQPYHSRILPQYSTARLLATHALGTVGIKGPIDAAVSQVAKRHNDIETYQMQFLSKKLNAIASTSNKEPNLTSAFRKDSFLVKFLEAKTPRNEFPKIDQKFHFNYPRNRVAKFSHSQSDAFDLAIEKKNDAEIQNLLGVFAEEFGLHSRTLANQILGR